MCSGRLSVRCGCVCCYRYMPSGKGGVEQRYSKPFGSRDYTLSLGWKDVLNILGRIPKGIRINKVTS